jgi:hypothetical protein
VFGNRVLRGVFGTKRDDVTQEWRKQYNEEHSDMDWWPDVVRIVNSIRKYCAGHLAGMGERDCCAWYWLGSTGEVDHLEVPGLHEYNIWKNIQKLEWEQRQYWGGSGQDQASENCECGNQLLGYIKCRDFLTSLYRLLSEEGLCPMQ